MYRIVLATDSPWVTEDAVSDLAGGEFGIAVVDSAPAAVDAVAGGGVDLVVLDMQIGSMGAPAVVAELRNDLDDRVAGTPVVCLLDRAADAWICRKMGATATLLKPFEPGSLERLCRRVIGEASTAHLGTR